MTFKIKKENYKLLSKVLAELGVNHNRYSYDEGYNYYVDVDDDILDAWIDKVYNIYVIRLESRKLMISLPIKLFEAIW